MQSIIPKPSSRSRYNTPTDDDRHAAFGKDYPLIDTPQPMTRLLNWGLRDALLSTPELVLLGEDISTKGGVYGVTRDLGKHFGRHRVIDSLLDEQSILGLAIGLAHNGFVPMPEIQFLAYLHNAEDQLRGEAASLAFFSDGQFANPMVIRIAGLGYQKGFGGHFHNDNSLAVLRDIPGIIVACPSHGHDAVCMLRSCIAAAREEGRVTVFLEPIALYNTKDLHNPDDKGWMQHYPKAQHTIAIGTIGQFGAGDVAIISYGNGHYLSRQAVPKLQALGINTRIIDLRWLSPLPEESLLRALHGVKAALVVDECRQSGNVGEGIMTLLSQKTDILTRLVAAQDSFIATGPAYASTMPTMDDIVTQAIALSK